ncbi:MAG: diguanylate cyclase [Micromonosporaceae bacterium]|nr:diguanylate cyclase [Micromonosporaceae bacterium]
MIPGVTIDATLGSGAFTTVYRGTRGGHRYAIKVLRTRDPAAELAFRREAALLACLDDPALVRIHEIGKAEGAPYLIMDLVDGSSLAQRYLAGAIGFQQLVEWAAEVAGALAVAHRAGLVHRDVKPANIMIDQEDRAKLIDFGLAGRTGLDPGSMAVGTFAYSAPEQTGMLSRAVDGRADLYGLGVVLFEGLTGRLPFTAPDVGELIRLHLVQPVPDLRQLLPDLPASLSAIVAKLLAKDPDDRYQTGEGVRADLSRVACGEHAVFPLGSTEPASGADDVALVGRQDALESLLSSWSKAAAGRGGMVLIEGAAGSGKRRLARELARRVAAGRRTVWHCRFFRDHSSPFALVRSVVNQHVETINSRSGTDRDDRLLRLQEAVGDVAGVLARMCPHLAASLAGAADSPAPAGDGGQYERALAGFLGALAASEGGALLCIDDLQWCDEASRRVLRQLALKLPGTPLLVTATVGTEAGSTPDELVAMARDRLSLGPLTQPEAAALLAAQLGSLTVPDRLVTQLWARTGGNPLAVREYAHAMLDAGLLRPAWGTWSIDEEGLRGLSLKDDVTDLILHRLTWLDEDARQWLTVAAVVGAQFDPLLIGEVGGIAGADALAALAAAASRHLIEPVPGGQYAFVHYRIRDALLAEVETDPGALRRLHRKIAERLERGAASGSTPASSAAIASDRLYAIAYHYLHGEIDQCPQATYRALAAAGFRALAEHSASDAFDYFSEAASLAEAAGIVPDGAFHLGAGTAALRIGRFASGDHHFEHALAVEPDPLRRAQIYIRLTDSLQQRWEGEQALEAVRKGLAELGRPVPAHRARFLAVAVREFLTGVVLGVLPRRGRAVAADRRMRCELRAELLNAGAQAAAAANQIPLFVAFNGCSLPVANRLGAGWPYLRSKVNLAILAKMLGLHRTCGKLLDAADAGVAEGDPRGTAFVAWARSLVADLVVGADARTGEATRACLERHGRWMDVGDLQTSTGMLGLLQIARGYPSEAVQLYRLTLDFTDDLDQIRGAAIGFVNPLAAAMLGRPAEAVSELREVQAFLATIPKNHGQHVNAAFAAVALAVEQGETGQVLDDALAEYASLNVKISQAWPFQRLFWVYQAFGRLSQVGAASPDQRAQRLAAAAGAVAELRKAANSPFLRALYQVAGASLRQVRGDHEGALQQLAGCARQSAGIDAPLLQYEVARASARALFALGSVADARRQVAIAFLLAAEGGWQARQQWLSAEFGEDSRGPVLISAAWGASRDAGSTAWSGRMTRDVGSSAQTAPSGCALDGQGRYDSCLRVLTEVNLAAATVFDPEHLARVALDEIIRVFGAERAFLFLVDQATGELVPHLGRECDRTDLKHLTGYGSSLVERVHRSGEPLVVTGTEQGAALGSESTVVYGLRSIMVAPLLLKGRTVGVVYLDSRAAKGVFSTNDLGLLTAVTTNVALSLETARATQLEVSVQAARRERDTAELLHGVMRELTSSLDLEEVASRLVATVTRILPRTQAFLVRDEGDGPRDEALAGLLEAASPVLGRCGPGEPPLPIEVPAGATAWLALPLIARGVPRGLIIAVATGHEYTEAELELAAALAGQGAVALDNAVLFHEVENAATYDGLTGLFNRRYFFDFGEHRMATWRRDERPIAAVMIDVDHFKNVNDTYGHAVGDEVIKEIAHRLSATLRESDIVGRYGGEEFAVLLPETTEDMALVAAHRMRREISAEPIATRAGELPITVSVGLAFPDKPSSQLSDLLRAADKALYVAKRNGRNQVVVSDG